MKENMNTYKGWELIDEDRFTWAKQHEDGHYSFIGLKEIGYEKFIVQKGEYDASDELEQDQWGVFMAVWEEAYGMDPDGYMTKEEWIENLGENYGNNIEIVVDKCLFWQDYDNEDVCTIRGWNKACAKVKGLLDIY